MNQVFLIGRIANDIVIREQAGRTVADCVLAVKREFKNQNGVYETEFFRITLWEGIAKHTKEYCDKGHLVLVRGRLAVNTYEVSEKNVTTYEIIAEKVVFLQGVNKQIEESEK